MSLNTVAQVDEAVETLRREGSSLRLGDFGTVTATAASLRGAATTVSEFRRANCDSILLRDFVCGDEQGLLLGVMTGNYKDDGTAVASSIGAVCLALAFKEPLLSEADIVPALRRAAIQANDDILRISQAPIGSYAFGTAVGSRKSMSSIGASLTAVAVLPTRLFGVHYGEGRAFLVRDGTASKLVLEHTLNHAPEFREAVRRGEDVHPCPEAVVIKVLGFSQEAPKVDVFKIDLRRGVRVVVGGLSLFDEIAQDFAGKETIDAPMNYRTKGRDAAVSAVEALARVMCEEFPGAPATVGVIDVA